MQQQIDLHKIEQSRDYISGYDDKLNIVIWNEALAAKYKIPKAEAIGKNVLELFPHVKSDDFRFKCLREAIAYKKMFFFSALPYTFEDRLYTQLILPGKDHNHFHVLSVVRDHINNEIYPRTDLLNSVMTPVPLTAE